MSVLCAIPGLIWPTTGVAEALSTLTTSSQTLSRALPGLSALLGQATVKRDAPCPLDSWLCSQFGLTDPPYAALRLAGERDGKDEATLWVCADPVSLRFARQHLLLDGPDMLNLQAEEMDSLLHDLNQTFSDIGQFRRTSLEHAYLALSSAHADKFPVALAPLPDVVNRPVAQFQPKGEHAAWWSRFANELQVFCHNHSVNAAREARGAPALNSLWLWGVGRWPSNLAAPATSLAAQLSHPNPILSGLVRLSNAKLAEINPRQAMDWTLIDALHEPAQQRDAARWATTLKEVDTQILVPLSQQLRNRTISQLTIVSPGDTALTRFEVTAAPRWKFWQREAAKTHILAALSSPAT